MAAKTATMLSNFEVSLKNERLLMNKLRDQGLEYVSTSGKVIAAKTQPVLFCHCPQKCKNKLPQEKWDALFKQFYELGDQNAQNQFLQSHIVIKAVHLHNWESEKSSPANKRRVTCRYHVPDLSDDFKLEDFIKRKGIDSIEVCQKAFMNCYGITEKRVRMQRERCISRLAPGHYKHSPFGKKYRNVRLKKDPNRQSPPPPAPLLPNPSIKKTIEFSNGLEITPLDLSNERRKKPNGTIENHSSADDSYSEEERERPLDLSNSKLPLSAPLSPSKVEIDKTRLYEIAEKIGLSKDRIDKEMADKYEELVRQNLRKHSQKLGMKNKRKNSSEDFITNYNNTEIENQSPLQPVADQLVGLGDDLTILPIQTLNNGDVTITPVLGPVSKPVENRDIMRVNTFFQNQLWKPEYIGLSSWRKLRSQSYDI